MPFTAKARRFFHAAAARGQRGMHKLADEADRYAAAGEELPPVGVAGTATHLLHDQTDAQDDLESGEPWSRIRSSK